MNESSGNIFFYAAIMSISNLSISDMSDVRSNLVQIGPFRVILKSGRRVGMVVTTMFGLEGGLQ